MSVESEVESDLLLAIDSLQGRLNVSDRLIFRDIRIPADLGGIDACMLCSSLPTCTITAIYQ